ncbi:hypothetical protein L915_17036, partial [Phytophthora nicotianae]
ADAVKLYDAGEGRWGTDETTFVRILFSSPREHLVLVNDIYKKKYVSDLEEAVRGEFSGYATEALVFYVRLALEPDMAIAIHFERMMKGLGTDEKGLSAAVIRYHWMQPRVEQLYEKLYGRSLEERIRTDTDANYGDRSHYCISRLMTTKAAARMNKIAIHDYFLVPVQVQFPVYCIYTGSVYYR